MNHLLARTKGKKGKLYKVLSKQDIYSLPDNLDNTVVFDSNYKLEDDEWFAIANFSEEEYCLDFLKNKFVSAEYVQIPKSEFTKMEFLCAYQSGVFYFQKVSSSQIIRRKYFSISDDPVLRDQEPIVIINSMPDAIFVKDNDTLYFKKLTSITTIFKGIYKLYKEATQEETEEFLKNDFINLLDDYSADSVKKANRKRIAMAMETLQKFSPKEKKNIFLYIREYCEDLDYDEEKGEFNISKEDELKKLLFGIEERYYTTKQGKEKRLANSVTKL